MRAPLKILSLYMLVQLISAPTRKVHCFANHRLKTPVSSHSITRRQPTERDTFKLDHIPQRFSRPPIDGNRDDRNNNNHHHYLPKGPPPYRPPGLMIALSNSNSLAKLRLPAMKWKTQERKIYYTFLDAVRTFHRLADQLAAGKIRLTDAKLSLLKSLIGKLALMGSKGFKLKWPLVMLNPHFLKELLANPTFLVMLFHAIEMGFVSSPKMNLWLKPLVKLVKQPTPEKEERSWWRRKRLYDTFNGIGSSELEPNLKTIHFRRPGKPVKVSLAGLTQLFPATVYGKSPSAPASAQTLLSYAKDEPTATTFKGDDYWPGEQQLLSQEEFDALDDGEKERIINEARQNVEEFLWTNELIELQNSFVESLQNKQLDDPDLDQQNEQRAQYIESNQVPQIDHHHHHQQHQQRHVYKD